MRKPFLVVGLVALIAGGCSSSSSTPGVGYTAPPLNYYRPTAAPYGAPTAAATAAPYGPAGTPYGGVTFASPGVNPIVDPYRDSTSTFGLDIDTASYTVARRFISDGHLPDPASVRVEEFVNYFAQDYEAPEDGTFAIYTDGGPSPFLARDETLLRIGIKAREVSDRVRPTAALTFVIDVSGSMAAENRLGLVKQSLALLVDVLRPDDRVGIVVFGSDARVVLRPTAARDRDEILGAIATLQPEGSTNAEAGLRLGYQVAREQFRRDDLNRVVFASDGVANVGSTDAESILRFVRDDAETGIQLVTVGFGMGNFNDTLLEQLADQGDGFYAYVDTLDEARRIFLDDLTGTLQSVALDARVQVTFDPSVVQSYRLIGFENRAINDRDFRNDNVQAGAIGAGHSVTALYALRLAGSGDRLGSLGTVHLRWIDPTSTRADEVAHPIRSSEFAASFREAAPRFQLDALVAATAERFRESEWGREYSLRDVLETAESVAGNLPHDDEVDGFLGLLRAATRLER